MEFNQENVKKIKELILFTAIVVVCLWKCDIIFQIVVSVLNILFPFLLGGAIAFVLNVPMNFVEKHLFPEGKKIKRPVSLLLVLTLTLGVLILVMRILVPQLGEAFSNLESNIRMFLPQLQEWMRRVFHNNKEIMNIVDDIEFAWNKIISGIATLFIAFVFAIYLLLQKEKLKIQVKKVLFAFVRKGRAEAVIEVGALAYKTFSGFLTGQCLEAVILGVMFVIAMAILKLPYALLIGILIGFLALVPVFGAFVGCIVGTALIFMVQPAKALLFVIVFLVLQQIEGNFIYPHVVGEAVGLPPIWVLAAVSIGGSLMGITGMLIFIPMASVFYALFREIVYLKLKKNKVDPSKIS